MTQSKLIVVGWTIFFSTLSLAAPKAKLGYAYSPKKEKAQLQARQQTQKKSFHPKHKAAPVTEQSDDLAGMDGVVYQAQKFASEMTQEVGYLLKATGPWLKEIEDQIRGVETAAPAATAQRGGRALASAKTPATHAPAATAPAVKRGGKRQLGEMSQNPNQIMETISSFSKDTWEKVNSVVSDLFASSEE